MSVSETEGEAERKRHWQRRKQRQRERERERCQTCYGDSGQQENKQLQLCLFSPSIYSCLSHSHSTGESDCSSMLHHRDTTPWKSRTRIWSLRLISDFHCCCPQNSPERYFLDSYWEVKKEGTLLLSVKFPLTLLILSSVPSLFEELNYCQQLWWRHYGKKQRWFRRSCPIYTMQSCVSSTTYEYFIFKDEHILMDWYWLRD